MPERIFQAMMAVALGWGWYDIAFLLGAGFLGLLRVHEFRSLTYGYFLTPSRLLSAAGPMYITVVKPKMRRLTARRSYTRIDDPTFVLFAEAFAASGRDSQLIFQGPYARLRRIFIAICEAVGLAPHDGHGLSWGSLRPGGATWLYRCTDNSELVRFRGRWASARMLETYIQEVGAVSLLPSLHPSLRERILHLAGLAPGLLADAALRCRASPV